ncbi:MAG: acyl-CoA synthetase [Acidimicrobiaceae bacterium]|nr:acyl-CoA synthetase [Acidimicrobiaceae bacterium]
MDIADHGTATPDKVALVMGSGQRRTYGALMRRSNRMAQLLYGAGLRRGDGVLLMLPNRPEFFEVTWAAQRSGLYYTPVNTHLTSDEVAYIMRDSGAKALVIDADYGELAQDLQSVDQQLLLRLSIGGGLPGYDDYETALAGASEEPPPEPSQGTEMMYSSGTTGYPKAVRRPLPGPEGSWAQATVEEGLRTMYGMTPSDVYLSPAPLYHSAPLAYSMGTMRMGATALVMERFDAERCLELIERERVTHGQFVPTMFVRMLKLPAEVRDRYDLSSMRAAVHSAAPCPVEVKAAMMKWWGPIIYEYYAGTEGFAATFIGPDDWLAHPGSVGKPANPVHIVDEDGNEVATGEPGSIYFEGGPDFEYHNDAAKTASVSNDKGWRTLGDVGYVDEEGYLYLTDRATFMVVSGGVNIYPQEIENALVMHPKVADAAVFGVPNDDFGEEVKAVVQPADWDDVQRGLDTELMEYCRSHLAGYKCPRSIDFEPELPRDPNGKLYKRRLRDRYWEGHSTRLL